MTTKEIAERLAGRCREGQHLDAITELYAAGIESIEPHASGDRPAKIEGIEAVRAKNQWWLDNHEIHETIVLGPWVNHDKFVVRYEFDFTPAGGERFRMEEVAVYTTRDGKIVKEEFFY